MSYLHGLGAGLSTHEIADQYVLWGLSIVPVKHGTKMPSVDWKPYQTKAADQAQIDRWFHNQDGGLGVVCGAVSGGLVCLDFDTPGAYEAFIECNPLAETYPTAISHRGKHVFFRSTSPVHSGDLYVKGIDGKAGDIIADRKFVVLPPTVHPEGLVRKWQTPLTKEIPTVDMRDLDLGKPPAKKTTQSEDADEDIYLKHVFPEGTRHNSLLYMALDFGKLDLSMEAIAEVIRQTNMVRCKPPLPNWEVDGIIRYVAENRGNFPHSKGGRDDESKREIERDDDDNIIIFPSLKDEHAKEEALYGQMFVSAAEYMETYDPDNPVDWLVKDMVPLSYLTVLGATSKAGKSCLVTNMAHSIATGGPFLGMETQKGSVLWLAYEESEFERRMILSKYDINPGNLYITHEKIKLDTRDGLKALRYWIHRTRAVLVVIDPLYSAVEAESLSDGRKARVALEGLKDLCRIENIAALVLHHFTKNVGAGMVRERFADSNQILATASMDLLMDWRPMAEGGREIRLSGTGRGDFANQDWVIHSPSPTEFNLIAHGTKEECRSEHVDTQILNAIASSPDGMTADEISRAVGSQIRAIQNRLTFMVKENRIAVIGKRGKANVYGSDRELLAG